MNKNNVRDDLELRRNIVLQELEKSKLLSQELDHLNKIIQFYDGGKAESHTSNQSFAKRGKRSDTSKTIYRLTYHLLQENSPLTPIQITKYLIEKGIPENYYTRPLNTIVSTFLSFKTEVFSSTGKGWTLNMNGNPEERKAFLNYIKPNQLL